MYDIEDYDNIYNQINHPLLRNTIFDNMNIDDSSTSTSSPSSSYSHSLLENKFKKEEEEELPKYKYIRNYKRKKIEPILYNREEEEEEYKEKNNDNNDIIINNEIIFPTNEMVKYLNEREFDIIYNNLKKTRTLSKEDIETLKCYRRKIKNRGYARNARNEKKILIQNYRETIEKLITENIYLHEEVNRLNNIIIKYDMNLLI